MFVTTPTRIVASRVRGAAVYRVSGEKIGRVEDLSIDMQSGRVLYALMAFGGVLGIGDRLHPIPWQMLHYDEDKQGYVTHVDREKLLRAPQYNAVELMRFGGAKVARSLDYFAGE